MIEPSSAGVTRAVVDYVLADIDPALPTDLVLRLLDIVDNETHTILARLVDVRNQVELEINDWYGS